MLTKLSQWVSIRFCSFLHGYLFKSHDLKCSTKPRRCSLLYISFRTLDCIIIPHQVLLSKTAKHWDSFVSHCSYLIWLFYQTFWRAKLIISVTPHFKLSFTGPHIEVQAPRTSLLCREDRYIRIVVMCLFWWYKCTNKQMLGLNLSKERLAKLRFMWFLVSS